MTTPAAPESEAAASWAGRRLRPPHSRPYFRRGVCWTTESLVTLRATEPEYRRALTRLRDAGANMIRVGGTMVYESDASTTLCDELGILVWQDFMFANMDYPVEDAAFAANRRRTRPASSCSGCRRHPSLAV